MYFKNQSREKGHRSIHDSLIEHFIFDLDLPGWYRAGSKYQMLAMERLFTAIRDDAEQRTVHRARACLEDVGIWPMVSSKDLQLVLHLSRGSDLAFLWFLWEMHYKTAGKQYCYNEQIILSGIAHLDMITTLRELDRIMPPGHPPKKVLERRRKKVQEEEERQKQLQQQRKSKKSGEKISTKKKCASPYFERLERQRPYGKPLSVEPPDFRINLQDYLRYRNPNYIVPNESNRWFTTFVPNTGARVTKSLLNDELDLIFGNIYKRIREKNVVQVINEVTQIDESKNEEEKIVYCLHHRHKKEIDNAKIINEQIIRKDCCIKSLKWNCYKKKMQLKRILDDLENNVESYRKIIRDKLKPSEKQNQVNVLGKECFCEYMIQGPGDDEEECRQPDLYLWVSEKGEVERLSSSSKVNPSNVPQSEIMRLTGGAEAEGIEIKKGNTVEVPKNVISGTVDPRKSNVSIASNTRFHETCPTSNVDTPESAEQFFIPPEEHNPYEFDYRKIFNFVFLNDEEKLKYKRLYLDALDCDEKEVKKLLDSTPDIMDAVNSYALKTWKELMAIQREKELEEEKKKKDATYIPIVPNIPVQETYDCDDNKLMASMLKEGLRYMCKNPKFVLASLEDAYKLPVLREWTYYRYGKTYTKAERFKSYRSSLKIFNALEKNPLNVTIPPLTALGTNTNELDYSCLKYVSAKANLLKKQYRDKLTYAIMEHGRNLWFALRPYLCSRGPPRNTYYAYIPPRARDIIDFRPWKPNEYVNAKLQWEIREKAKRKKEKIPD